jgi:serine/threonine-protein kinase HipA
MSFQTQNLVYVYYHGLGSSKLMGRLLLKNRKIFFDLDDINNDIQATLNDNDAYVDDLLVLGGSSAGARPKVLLPIDGDDWLIKFRSSLDPKDISAIEYAYHLMAKEAGLILPEAKLFPSKKGLGYFAVKRFDRKNNERIHMHTIAGLLHADHREPCLDYENVSFNLDRLFLMF